MKWLAFTALVVVALITLGILAVDERDVVWEGRTALCPYCRAELPRLALVCPNCGRSLDWVPHGETCPWCLSAADVSHLDDLFESLDVERRGLPPELKPWGAAYFRAMEPGACAYCGGLGVVRENGVEVVCPVCRGDKRCIACGGDRTIVVGDPGAHRRALERKRRHAEAERRARLTGLPLRRRAIVDRDVRALRGYAEAERLVDEQGRNLLERARRRVESAFAALHKARERREREGELTPAGERSG